MTEAKPKPSLDLYEEFRDSGHMGKYETDTYHAIEAKGSNPNDDVVLTIETRKGLSLKPDQTSKTWERFTIKASALVDLIKKHGERQP